MNDQSKSKTKLAEEAEDQVIDNMIKAHYAAQAEEVEQLYPTSAEILNTGVEGTYGYYWKSRPYEQE